MKRSLILAAALPVLLPSFHAQEADPVAEVESAGRNILSDPRLKNVLRSVKQDPASAIEGVKRDPEESVREATRLFQEKTNGIDAETLKAAAAKAKSEGMLDQAAAKAGEAVERAKVATKPAPAAPPAAAAAEPGAVKPPAARPAAVRTTAVPVAAEPEVPATRPAPGISGGAPTPVAMPVEEGAPVVPAADAPAPPPPGGPLPGGVAAASGDVIQESRAEAIAGAAPTAPAIPELPDLSPDAVPGPVPLSKQFHKGANGAYPSADRRHMEILSKESLMDNTKGVLLFTGNVFIDHPEFEIKCDKLEIQLAEGVGMEGSEEAAAGGNANFKRAIASGGMVEIKRMAKDEKGRPKTQIAIARIADYNATTKDIVLSGGPPYIQDGDRFVKTNSEDAKIIMRGNGFYEVTGSTNRSQIVIPIENKGGPGKKGEIGLPGGLEGTFDRMR